MFPAPRTPNNVDTSVKVLDRDHIVLATTALERKPLRLLSARMRRKCLQGDILADPRPRGGWRGHHMRALGALGVKCGSADGVAQYSSSLVDQANIVDVGWCVRGGAG